MASHINDITGNTYGRLTVLYRSPFDYIPPCGTRSAKWVCRCTCGSIVEVIGKNLIQGKTISCGCARKEIVSAIKKTHGDSRNSRLYRIYNNMLNRCNNPNATYYNRYGGRGIMVCHEWKDSYVAFRKWALENGYQDNLTIDRIDNNGNYEPQNCRWITQSENSKKSFEDRKG